MAQHFDSRPYEAATDAEARRPRGRVPITIAEREKRLAIIETMLIKGIPISSIERRGATDLKMSKVAVRKYIDRIRAKWKEEEREARPHYKASAMRRIIDHIADARRDKNWAAVAQFEKLLSEMQGTKEPLEVALTVNDAVNDALVVVVSRLTPERRAELIAQARSRALAVASESSPAASDSEPVPAVVEG